MNILQDVRALSVAVLVILVIIGLIWNQRKSRPKTGPVHRQAAHDLAASPANRSARRANEFAEVNEETSVKRRRAKQQAKYEEFLAVIERLKEAGRIHGWSVFTFGKNLLAALETAIGDYTCRSMIQGRVENHVSAYQWILMTDVSKALMEYSGGKGLQAIALDLLKICEKYYKLNGLNGVLYRHKGHIHYNDRCDGMSTAIVRFFAQHVPSGAKEAAMAPIDLLSNNELIPNEMFRRTFYIEAIDRTYSEIMKQTERTNFAAQARKDQQEHEKNRRQRAKRVTRKKRRN
ncbi:MAG TPA: hypothetical protein VF905_06340 [Nitrospirota bacterium]